MNQNEINLTSFSFSSEYHISLKPIP